MAEPPGVPRVRIAWGRPGLDEIAPHAAVVVIVDILRFTTAVTVAVAAGASVLPYPWRDEGEAAFAAANDAVLAGLREEGGWSLSPVDLERIPAGTRLVLPSPNGSALAFAAHEAGVPVIYAGSLRNATAVGRAAVRAAGTGTIVVVAAGELARSGQLRMAVEDLTGAGAVIEAAVDAGAAPSEAAEAAAETFHTARLDLHGWLAACASGRELIALGFADDVDAAARLDTTDVVPVLEAGVFVPTERPPGSRAAMGQPPDVSGTRFGDGRGAERRLLE